MARLRPPRFLPVLWRKLLRDLWTRKGALTALVLIIAIGVGCYVGMSSLYRDMDEARTRYYAAYRLSHFAVDMKRAPASALESARTRPNVAAVRGLVNLPARIDLADRAEPINGTALSMPVSRQPVLNDLHLRTGTWFSGTRDTEVIVNHAFARENGLRPGQTLAVILLDRQHDLLIVGTASSPEYVYLLGAGGIAPDPARFGVIYLPEKFLQQASDLDGAYNQIIGWTHDTSPAAIKRTTDDLEALLDPYGVTGSRATADQASVRFLADELDGLRVQSKVLPLIFLVVAALVLNLMLGRVVAQQRSTIGVLRALGHTRWAIRRHYVGFGALIGAVGGAAGALFGMWIQSSIIPMYQKLFEMPGIAAHQYPDIMLSGIGISLACALLGTVKGMRLATHLEPAEAMHPPPPERGRAVLLERALPFVWRRLSFQSRMILRAVFRNPVRSATGVLSTLLSTGLIVTMLHQVVCMDYMMEHTFKLLAHQDVTVSLREPVATHASSELAAMPDVTYVEPQLALACTLSHGFAQKRVGVTGLARGSHLMTPLDNAGNRIAIPDEGLVLSSKLAEILSVAPGDTLTLRPLIGRRETVSAPVIATFDTYMGLSAYADLDYLSRLIGEDGAANVYLGTTAGGGKSEPLLREIKARPGVVGIDERTRALEQVQKTWGDTMDVAIWLMVLFSGLIGFGSTLNTTLVSLSERQREVGTLRVLGYTPAQVSRIFSGESLLVGAIGTALGVWAGVGLVHLVSALYSTELFRFPALIVPAEMVRGAAVMLAFLLAAQVIVHQLIRRLDWLEAVKSRE